MAQVQPIAAAPAAIDAGVVQAISDWLVESGLNHTALEAMFGGFCERISAGGMSLARCWLATETLHPSIGAMTFLWNRDKGVESFAHEYRRMGGSAVYRRSPPYHMQRKGLTVLRRRLEGEGAVLDFSLLEDLKAQGITDYLVRAVAFGQARWSERRSGIYISFAYDRPGGFSDGDLAVLDRLLPRFTLSLNATLTQQISVNRLNTYIGPLAGRRVLSGEIRRGSVEIIKAAVIIADLRGFTTLVDRANPLTLTPVLNDYLDCMVEPVHRQGGEVLKFLGDGLLATFALEGQVRDDVCEGTLGAATAMLERVADLNERRLAERAPVMEIDIALHLGDVLYGNVGADDRLDFTVIGAAVNEASRMEVLCRKLGQNLLISQAFADAATRCRPRMVAVGQHRLRGIRGTHTLYALQSGVDCVTAGL